MIKKLAVRNAVLLVLIMLILSLGIIWWVDANLLGGVKQVQRQIGVSTVYTTDEIDAAIDRIIAHFRSNFSGCELLNIWYDEARSLPAAEGWRQQYGADEAIVLYSDFKVNAKDAWKQGLETGETYRNWCWVLVRNGAGAWELKTWGYG